MENTMDTTAADMDQFSSDNDPGKMFVGGLSWNTSEETLRNYFAQFGDIVECCVMQDPVSKRSRGFGFIKFVDAVTVDRVLYYSDTHIVDGKKIDPKRAVPKNQSKLVNRTKKVFLGGLAPDTTDEDVKMYFRQYGEIEEVMLMYDKNTQRLRGFGFVKFCKEDHADEACRERYHEIKGKMIEAKKAQPKEVMSSISASQRPVMLNGLMDTLPYPIYGRNSILAAAAAAAATYNPLLNYQTAFAGLQPLLPSPAFFQTSTLLDKKTQQNFLMDSSAALRTAASQTNGNLVASNSKFSSVGDLTQMLALSQGATTPSQRATPAGLLDIYTACDMSMLTTNQSAAPTSFFTTDTTQLLAAFNGYQ